MRLAMIGADLSPTTIPKSQNRSEAPPFQVQNPNVCLRALRQGTMVLPGNVLDDATMSTHRSKSQLNHILPVVLVLILTWSTVIVALVLAN